MNSVTASFCGFEGRILLMDGNNQMAPALGGEAPVDGGDWRATLQAASRQRIVNKM
ncbi:unnamed protein product [Linum tenue]|uniref:Uncharacterized protein n=1 Tax=Linum tenue TaxID=586396 RepID=A0AAV0H6S5_9ROSI|nr:unnamed protein product [Linum tenue]